MYKPFYTLYINVKYFLYRIFEFWTFRTKPSFEILNDDDFDIENDIIEIEFVDIRV
jgi:hypothetical protein